MSKKENEYFEVLTDIFLGTIQKKNYRLVRKMSKSFYSQFGLVRRKQSGQPVVYPKTYYQLVYKTIQQLSRDSDPSFQYLKEWTGGSIWLLGEISKSNVSNETYRWIWHNLSSALESGDDNIVLYHWKTATQYATFQEFVEPRTNYENFVHFHYIIGGLLLYFGKYELISKLFQCTIKDPPDYPLLRERVEKIYSFYINNVHFLNTEIYPFPGISGITANDRIEKSWINSYLALLFIRQCWTDLNINTRHIDFPYKNDILDLWIDGIPQFRDIVGKHLENPKILKILELDYGRSKTQSPTNLLNTWGNTLQRQRPSAIPQVQGYSQGR